MVFVPKYWSMNMKVMMASTIGTTGAEALNVSSPSMAVVTVMAGVMTPSATSVLAPMIAAT